MEHVHEKSFRAEYKAAGDGPALVSDGDLALINALSLVPLTAEEVYVRRMRLCNDVVDRAWEHFAHDYLTRFVETLAGKSLLASHNSRSFALGRFFRCELEKVGGVESLIAYFYVVRTPENQELRTQIDGGVYNHVSIGFYYDKLLCELDGLDYYGYVYDENGNVSYCPHRRGQVYGGKTCTLVYGGDVSRVEAIEASIVYLGCQYDSQMVKSASGETVLREVEKLRFLTEQGVPVTPGRNDLETKKDGVPAEAGEGRKGDEEALGLDPEGLHEVALAALEHLAEVEVTRDEACEQRGALAAELGELRELVAFQTPRAQDGDLYRADLAAEVTRLAGLVGSEKEAAAVLKVTTNTAPALKELRAEYQARADKAYPPQGKGTPVGVPEAAADFRTPRSAAVL